MLRKQTHHSRSISYEQKMPISGFSRITVKNFEWFSVDVSHVKSRIMTVNVYENKLLIGTQKGLYEIDLPRHY
jgi:hypothetical protein